MPSCGVVMRECQGAPTLWEAPVCLSKFAGDDFGQTAIEITASRVVAIVRASPQARNHDVVILAWIKALQKAIAESCCSGLRPQSQNMPTSQSLQHEDRFALKSRKRHSRGRVRAENVSVSRVAVPAFSRILNAILGLQGFTSSPQRRIAGASFALQ